MSERWIFHSSESHVTSWARNLTFGFNWLLLIFILANGSVNVDYHHELGRMFGELIKHQNLNENFILLMRCTMKDVLIFVGLFRLVYEKCSLHTYRDLSAHERPLKLFLFLPNIVMTLVSNRIYVAYAVIKHFLMKNASDLQSTALHKIVNIKLCVVNFSRVHSAFVNFNE